MGHSSQTYLTPRVFDKV